MPGVVLLYKEQKWLDSVCAVFQLKIAQGTTKNSTSVVHKKGKSAK